MYQLPPTLNISLQDFETYAYERSKGNTALLRSMNILLNNLHFSVLHYLDSLSVSAVKHSEAYNDKLKEFLRKNYPGFLLTVSRLWLCLLWPLNAKN